MQNSHDTTVVISIGRNVNDEPMNATAWYAFRIDLSILLGDAGANVVFRSPASDPFHRSGFGTWQGVTNEEAYTTIALVPSAAIPYLRRELAKLASDYGQDAIGFIVADGVENFVEANPLA